MHVPVIVGRPAYRLYQLAWTGLDLLYPPHCGGCDRPGSRWCTDCQRTIQLVPASICDRCGQLLNKAGNCNLCLTSKPQYTAIRSWAIFGGPIRKAIHRLKYEGDISLGEVLARPMLELLKQLNWQIDLITPVPIGVARRAQRGYNQASLLAWPLALGSGIPFCPQALSKSRDTRSQVGLSLAERRDNVADAFLADKRWVAEKRVLVVDDVATSGATMAACAAAMMKVGAQQVYGLTLTRATSHAGPDGTIVEMNLPR